MSSRRLVRALCLTESERAELAARASEAGMCVATYVRWRLLSSDPVAPPSEADRRTRKLVIYMSDGELARANRTAHESGRTLAEFARLVAIGGEP